MGKQIDISGGSKAIIVFVPFRQLKKYHEIQGKLVRELEKKLSGRHVVIIAQRTILNKNCRRSKRITGPRPRSRTLTAVHDAILEDLVYPGEISARRTRVKVDGSRVSKITVDSKDPSTEQRLEAYTAVYRKLTGKDVTFLFPAGNKAEL